MSIAARERQAAKASALRRVANAKWGMKDLLEIFGMGLAHRLRTNPMHGRIGKNFFSNHFHAGAHNPAGSKLLRRFIRHSNKEQTVLRKSYAGLTGRQYNHLNNPEQ